MPRRGTRVRLDIGVYRDASGIEMIAKAGGTTGEVLFPQETSRTEWLKKGSDMGRPKGAPQRVAS